MGCRKCKLLRLLGAARESAPRLAATVLLLLAAGLLLGGCDPMARYLLLSFFFDGVPPPDGMAAPGDKNAGTAAQSSTQPADKEVITYFHAPYASHRCSECHSSDGAFQAAAEKETCRKCHPSYYDLKPDDWVHGPLAVAKCSFCHAPHKAENAALLLKPQPTLCFSCHVEKAVLSRPYHVEAASVPCGECHDPHSAGNRLLLADARTYERRKAHAQALASPHKQWDKQQCSVCHLAEKSNQLLPNIDKVCISCHEKVRHPILPESAPVRVLEQGKLHEAVRQEKCSVCHTPHQSPRPHLIKPEAEGICFQCHKLKEIQTAAHPPVRRADCLLCHNGHNSPRAHLLKPATSRPSVGQDVQDEEPSTHAGPDLDASAPEAPAATPSRAAP